MAKKAILDVLEHTIGKYVRNLDAESLNVAVWSGKVELQNLLLDVDAVNAELARQAVETPNLAIPIRVISGSFQVFQVDVPWARITSKPVVFRARGLSIVAEPFDHLSGTSANGGTASDGNKRGKNKRAQDIDRSDASRLRTNAFRKLAADDGGDKKSSFTGRLVRRIIENLQLEIDDVSLSLRGCGCLAGIVLGSLSLVTTDENGNRSFVDRSSGKSSKKGKDLGSFLHKALRITGFGIYLDECQTLVNRSGQMTTPRFFPQKVIHSYILSPLSFQATLRQSDSFNCIDFPKYLVCSKLSKLSVRLTRTQLELANKVALAIKPKKTHKSISVFGIMAWRDMADAQVEREKEKHELVQAAKKQQKTKTKRLASLFKSKGDHSATTANE